VPAASLLQRCAASFLCVFRARLPCFRLPRFLRLLTNQLLPRGADSGVWCVGSDYEDEDIEYSGESEEEAATNVEILMFGRWE
jgi:hypothetical protein